MPGLLLRENQMPYTVSFSRQFREKLGDDVVNELVDWLNTVELTYKSELREHNEIHLQRVEGVIRLETSRLDLKIDKLDARMGRLETRFDGLETRFDGLETRFDGLGTRFDRLGNEVGALGSSVSVLVSRVDALASTVDNLVSTVDGLASTVDGLVLSAGGIGGKIEVATANLRAELLKWMFVFWASSVLLLIGLR